MKYIITTLILFTNFTLAQQICTTEAEIPSTTPDSRFTDNGDGTISDNGTGLMWQKCQLGLSGSSCNIGSATDHTWQQALDEAEQSSIAGYNDWRLPNHKELLSIVEHRCYNPSINTTYFPNTSNWLFWSSSSDAYYPNSTWYVIFDGGFSYSNLRSYYRHVRLVRFGQ
ncbi:MAG: DUF1566 domain-containing protein [Xanthomonadales bacterium]|nr:DUF1566 domain-containing protein [Xanthomonadales bacterium]